MLWRLGPVHPSPSTGDFQGSWLAACVRKTLVRESFYRDPVYSLDYVVLIQGLLGRYFTRTWPRPSDLDHWLTLLLPLLEPLVREYAPTAPSKNTLCIGKDAKGLQGRWQFTL